MEEADGDVDGPSRIRIRLSRVGPRNPTSIPYNLLHLSVKDLNPINVNRLNRGAYMKTAVRAGESTSSRFKSMYPVTGTAMTATTKTPKHKSANTDLMVLGESFAPNTKMKMSESQCAATSPTKPR
jgi:hypothetical protein